MFLLGQTVGKYQVLANLGSGGFGTVFLAKDVWIDKKVAIKVPHRQTGDFDDLIQEPRLLAALDHPNIVGIVTAERVEGVFFIVMDYVKGESLEAVLDREKSLDTPRALAYAAQILKGVDHAHQAQILHRDLRPANVLVSESGLVRVADFGTSRLLEKSHATTVIGSPPYMAPEQFQGKAVFASDVYSLGVSMYQMLTGDLPYQTPSPTDLERLMKGELAAPPRSRNPKLPKAISDIVMKAMAPDIPARFQRASELLDAVLAARGPAGPRRPWRPAPLSEGAAEDLQDIQARLKAREAPQGRFCWKCRKALHARADNCPFCGELQ
jgi:serine/threonine-protein kinase